MGVFLGGSLFDNVVKMSVMERMNYGGIFGGISETVKMLTIRIYIKTNVYSIAGIAITSGKGGK